MYRKESSLTSVCTGPSEPHPLTPSPLKGEGEFGEMRTGDARPRQALFVPAPFNTRREARRGWTGTSTLPYRSGLCLGAVIVGSAHVAHLRQHGWQQIGDWHAHLLHAIAIAD